MIKKIPKITALYALILGGVIFCTPAQTHAMSVDNPVTKIEIETVSFPKDDSDESHLSQGGTMDLQANVQFADGSFAKAGEADVSWEITKTNGKDVQALLSFPKNKAYASADTVLLYAPYHYEEKLQITASVGTVSATKEITTFANKKNPSNFFSFHTMPGEEAPDCGVESLPVDEKWDVDTGTYRIVLPSPIFSNNYEDRDFIGWRHKKGGKVYSFRQEISVSYQNKTGYPLYAAWQKMEKGTCFVKNNARYQVSGKKTVAVARSLNIIAKKQIVPDTLHYDGITYKVTSIAPNAYQNTGITDVQLGKNVTTIGTCAFKDCRKLKRITITSKKIKSVGKKSFQNISTGTVIQCPKAKVKAYTKLFRKAGLNKKVTIKGV